MKVFHSAHPSFSLLLPRVNYRRRQWHPTPVLLPGKSHGRRRLEGCSPWGRWELDTTERLHFHFSLSCIRVGNGNPLQCSCLENPRDGASWWAAVYGVAESQTQLKWLSSKLHSTKKKKKSLNSSFYLFQGHGEEFCLVHCIYQSTGVMFRATDRRLLFLE